MDLPENWEKKALIAVVAVFLILMIYAYNPFQSKPNVTLQNQSPNNGVPIPFPQTNKSSNNSTNATLKLTAEQAKNIAIQSRPGYSVGQPIEGSVMVNNTNYNVWIVPVSKNSETKTLFIDVNTGIIVLER